MARLPRYVIPGQPQHIIQRGNNRQVIFAAEADFQFFRDALVDAAGKHGLAIHAYVWMTNHIHLLATPAEDNSISKVFQSVGRKYVQYFNFTYKRSGTLWEGRYRATEINGVRHHKIPRKIPTVDDSAFKRDFSMTQSEVNGVVGKFVCPRFPKADFDMIATP